MIKVSILNIKLLQDINKNKTYIPTKRYLYHIEQFSKITLKYRSVVMNQMPLEVSIVVDCFAWSCYVTLKGLEYDEYEKCIVSRLPA